MEPILSRSEYEIEGPDDPGFVIVSAVISNRQVPPDASVWGHIAEVAYGRPGSLEDRMGGFASESFSEEPWQSTQAKATTLEKEGIEALSLSEKMPEVAH